MENTGSHSEDFPTTTARRSSTSGTPGQSFGCPCLLGSASS
ncbi:hypothetical protein Golob_006497 [Gossypium lobatum]|uniref:Uncharacterized protein n=1 Tax=Gossypium lobatum TaxID=34289 RepID=A0A7J8MWM7_9ROSI|nr:hypothetical protein [Gossypium lobatum]